ncbi:hypothetical protein PGIGA_G00239270 [Pangasianodon gigas]|uniref:Uncharacterized protein n=1 Tax=Pangasianodon gigas TaxID=30993 RepID=A0ACC5WNU8_PANGG|nr:hypothetical protein [Pangasianodon gigas]
MKSSLLFVWTAAFFLAHFSQCVSGKDCVCELKNLVRPFPIEKLDSIRTAANQCMNSITSTEVCGLRDILCTLNILKFDRLTGKE